MAAITSANVSTTRSFELGSRGGAMVEVVKDLIITLSAQGGTAADIPASALGMAKIYTAFAYGLLTSGTMYGSVVGVVSDGSSIFPIAVTDATDATRATAANVTGNLYVRVTGTSAR